MVLMEALDNQKKSLVVILLKETQSFVWVYLIMLTVVICLLMEKKSLSLKLTKNLNFPTQFCFEWISNRFNATESREVSLIGNVYDFLVDYTFIDKSEILNIHKYLIVKSNRR